MARTKRPTTWLSVAEAAERLGMSRRHVARLIQDGELAAVNMAGADRVKAKWRTTERDLDRFERRRQS